MGERELVPPEPTLPIRTDRCGICAGLGATDSSAEWYAQRCWACGGSGWRTYQVNADGTETWI